MVLVTLLRRAIFRKYFINSYGLNPGISNTLMKRLIIIILLLFPLFSRAQTINTYAGSGIGYPSSGIIDSLNEDGGLAINSEIGVPWGLNFDRSGNLIVCEQVLVRKINKVTNIISTIAGSDTASSLGHGGDGGPAICASIISPFNVCYDDTGNFYIADNWYGEVRKVSIASGIIDTFAGNRSLGSGGDGGLAKEAELSDLVGVAFDSSRQYLYVSQGHSSSRVRRINMATGIITAFAGIGGEGFSGDGGPAINAQFNMIDGGICFDHLNNLYISDGGNGRIRKVDAVTGIVTTFAGNGTIGSSGDGGPATEAMIDLPGGMCFDKCGNFYFSSWDSNRVRRIDGITGIITTVAGNGIMGFAGDSGLAVNAELHHPYGVCIDSSCNLFIADQNNNRIRKVTIFNPYIKIATLVGCDTICAGSTVTITATVAGGGPTPTYQWVVNGVAMGATTSSSYTYIPATGDSVSCILTSNSPCVGNTTAVSNTIHFVTETTIVPTITLSGTTMATPGTTVTVTATVSGAGSSYTIKWYDNGVLFATTTSPTTTYTMTTGADTITATIIPSGSCYDSTTSAAHVVVANNEGVAGIMSPSINIYPNPAHSDVVVTGDNISLIKLSNTIGQALISMENISGKTTIDIAALPPGVYLVTVTTTEGQRIITRLVKQ